MHAEPGAERGQNFRNSGGQIFRNPQTKTLGACAVESTDPYGWSYLFIGCRVPRARSAHP
jgi:hypothetical protein